MADIELVIKVPEEIYRASQIIDVKYEDVIQIPLEVIANSIPLPIGHGDLIDIIKLKAKMFDLLQQPKGNYWDGVDAVGDLIDNAPIIIEADKVENEDQDEIKQQKITKIYYDKKTKEYFKEHPEAQTNVCKCSLCGVLYKASLGHECKYRKDKNE